MVVQQMKIVLNPWNDAIKWKIGIATLVYQFLFTFDESHFVYDYYFIIWFT